MSFIFDNASDNPIFKVGFNGNYYVYSKLKNSIEEIAKQIGKSESSVYFNSSHQVWAIRVRLKNHKEKLKQLFMEV